MPISSPAPFDLDMAAAGWKPTVDNFLGGSPRPHSAGGERGEGATCRGAHRAPEEGDMAREAEAAAGEPAGCPEPLRGSEPAVGDETAAQDGTTAMGEDESLEDTEDTRTSPLPWRRSNPQHDPEPRPAGLSAGLCF